MDINGTQLSPEEQRIVKAAVAASAKLHNVQQGGQCTQGFDASSSSRALSPTSPGAAAAPPPPPPATAAAAAAAAGGIFSSAVQPSAAAAAAGATAAAAAAGPSAPQVASVTYPTTVMTAGGPLQVPLLPQLRVLRVTSLWWRLPLCVLSGVLEEVAYKRLTSSEYGSYVMTDLQVGFESFQMDLNIFVLSGVLEEVAYKRLTSSEYGSYVMTDLQVRFEL
jgi:hypothetical protein